MNLNIHVSTGIDIQNRRELISLNHTVDEVCEIIGADSLTYPSLEGLIESVIETDAPNGGLVWLTWRSVSNSAYDYEERYLKAEGKTSLLKRGRRF